MFWFQDGVHWPTVLTPWDATFFELAIAALSQYNTRHYMIPPALGIDARIVNGYGFLTPVPVADPAEIERRVPLFLERAGFYFGNWDRLYDNWLTKMRSLVAEIQSLKFEPLPEMEDIAVDHRGPRHRLRADPAGELPPAARPLPEAVDAPLRVPQPRLRRLPGLLRLLQAGVPEHPGPGDRQDGRRRRRRPVPPGRRAQEARPARGRAEHRRRARRRRPPGRGRRAV